MKNWQRTLWVMFTAQLFSSVGFSAIFPFLPNYVEALGSRTGLGVVFWVAAVFSVQGLTLMFAAPIWGGVADRYGRKLMVERALFGGAVLIVLMGFVRSAEELVLLRAVQGAVTGVVSAGNSLVAAAVPRNRIGFAMGMLQTALWSGVSVGPIIGGTLEYAFGFRVSFLVTGVLLFLGGVLVLFGIREEFTPRRRDRGLAGYVKVWRNVLTTPGVNLAFLARFLAWLGRNVLVPFLPLFIAAISVDPELAGLYTGLAIGSASAAGTLAALFLGRLGDRLGHKRILVASALAAAVFYLPMSLVTTVWQLLLLNILTGAAIGGILPSISALLAHLTERGEEGSVYGLDTGVTGAARLVAPIVGGLVVALGTAMTGEANYRGVFLATALLFFVTMLVVARHMPDIRPETERD